MFIGSIPSPLRSGNFTIERVLAPLQRFVLYSNDVSIYSSMIGAYLSDTTRDCALREDRRAYWQWLDGYLVDQESVAATLMIMTRIVDLLDGQGNPKPNAWTERMMRAYRMQFPTLHAQTVDKLRAIQFRVKDYHCGDVLPWAEAASKDAAFCSFPPFYAGGYERLYQRMESIFTWEKPVYGVMGEPERARLLRAIVDRRDWLFATQVPQPEYAQHLIGSMQPTIRAATFYIYGSKQQTRIVVPAQALKASKVPRLVRGMALGDRLHLAVLKTDEFNALRAQYMNISIAPASAGAAYGVLVDDVLIGVFATSTDVMQAGSSVSYVYMMTDFAVAPTDYPKLSKLVLMAAPSREAKLLYERMAKRRVRTLFTTAFTNRPNSMKYRGLFAVESKTEHPEREKRYTISYRGEVGQWSLNEALMQWKAKYSTTSTSSSSGITPNSTPDD